MPDESPTPGAPAAGCCGAGMSLEGGAKGKLPVSDMLTGGVGVGGVAGAGGGVDDASPGCFVRSGPSGPNPAGSGPM